MRLKYFRKSTKKERFERIRRRNIDDKLENGEELTENDLRSVDDILADMGDAECHRQREEGNDRED